MRQDIDKLFNNTLHFSAVAYSAFYLVWQTFFDHAHPRILNSPSRLARETICTVNPGGSAAVEQTCLLCTSLILGDGYGHLLLWSGP
jgi:hypothetical protein